ncbi:GDSL-type esterase/lipase family protein [Jiangella mangrovi]|uniref:Lysophospholipase L1-like esterase n=1 Tax=Jiangella mangrovi TaxID=1524084 RepID=A0A7W9LJ13_9ACTN|nr:GDSL-type esterase/lipase family protein [Jiangella mangrovi]MBB5785636.1 lysophospholipase L1-like esterase [Jiangella mangrovi]
MTVGAWTTATALLDEVRLADVTVRMVVRPSIGGDGVRLRLSNVFGTAPVTFSAVTAGSREVTFGGGAGAVTVAAGGFAVSDPVPSFAVTGGTDVVVGLRVVGVVETVTGHLRSSQTTTVTTAGGSSDEVLHWFFLDRLTLDRPEADGAVVVVGDSLTDSDGGVPDRNLRWPDRVAAALRSSAGGLPFALLNAGMAGNRVTVDGFGPSLLVRLDRDALTQPGVHTLMLFEGINDLSRGVTAAGQLIAAYDEVIARARARGLAVLAATMTPFHGAEEWTPEREEIRQAANAHLRTAADLDAVADFDAALRDPARPDRLRPEYDSGDHLHLTDAGRARLAEAALPVLCGLTPAPTSR